MQCLGVSCDSEPIRRCSSGLVAGLSVDACVESLVTYLHIIWLGGDFGATTCIDTSGILIGIPWIEVDDTTSQVDGLLELEGFESSESYSLSLTCTNCGGGLFICGQ